MKRIIAIVLLCWSAGVMAEEKVWFCTEVASAGLHFEYGKYKTRSFTTKRITIKQDGSKFTFPDTIPYDSFYGEVECKHDEYNDHQMFACTSSNPNVVFTLNPDTGLASMVRGVGWALENKRPDSYADSIYGTALECETF